MGHGSVAEEIKRRRGETRSRVLSIEEEGVRFRSYTDGSERFMGPETSMEVQAALGSDIALAFDECTPFHVERDYTRSLDGAHPSLARPLRGVARRARARTARRCTGSCRAGWRRTCARSRRPTWRRSARRGSRSAARWGRTRRRCARCWAGRCATCPTEPPRHLLGIGDVDDIVHAVGAGIDTLRLRHADPAGAPRHRAGARPRQPLAAGPDQGRPARAGASRSWRAARARRAATTPAATCTTWRGAGS